ncbi:MAG: dipeptide epimerase [Pirellulaceae bacterium]|nr:MAG: dipeptide epimerase [Pirellulaceae bacterium]
MNISLHPFQLRLRDPFTIARETTSVQPTLIVRVEYDGLVGWGEATANNFYGVTIEGMQQLLRQAARKLRGATLENPAEIWADLDPLLRTCRFAQCALDCALWDIYAQMHHLPLWQLWGFAPEDSRPPTSYTIGIDTPQRMVEKLRAMPEWPIYKIKVGADGGLKLVETLRTVTSSRFRVDANCSWERDRVVPLAEQLAVLDVELIEQPLPPTDDMQMRKLKSRSPLPLMADESCQTESDIDPCIEYFDAVNIKLVKCGGLTPARRMITRARQHGLRVMVGCMTESSIGIGAAVHLLPLLDYADLDGALLLAEDLAEGLTWERGVGTLTDRPGLGVYPGRTAMETIDASLAADRHPE